MGALDDLIARDTANRQQAEQSALGALLERDALMQREAQATADAPSFVGYQPTERAPEPSEPDPWEQLRAARERMGGGADPIEKWAQGLVARGHLAAPMAFGHDDFRAEIGLPNADDVA